MIAPILLVTGAPRSGTTPLGHMLSMLPGAVDLYEPMGLTGDRRFNRRFPIPGEPGFSSDDLARFVRDMSQLTLQFKSQQRPSHRGLAGAVARLFGTRTLWSYRVAKLTPGRRLLVWKDPHAIFCVPMGIDTNFRAVVSIRSPQAHAASFKRLGWISQIDDIYPRYCAAFGEVPGFQKWIDRLATSPFGSAALLWHLIHLRIVNMPPETRSNTFLFNMEKVAQDESAAYEELFAWLGEAMPNKARNTLIKRRSASKQVSPPKAGRVHDFNRTAAQANSYWREILSADEVTAVTELNGPIWSELTGT
jgi:hypothetical protein